MHLYATTSLGCEKVTWQQKQSILGLTFQKPWQTCRDPSTLSHPTPFPSSSKPFQTIHKFKGPVSSYHPITSLSLGDIHVLIHVTLSFHWKFKAEHGSEKGSVNLQNLIFSVNLKPWFFNLGSHWNHLGSFLKHTDAWFILLEIFFI